MKFIMNLCKFNNSKVYRTRYSKNEIDSTDQDGVTEDCSVDSDMFTGGTLHRDVSIPSEDEMTISSRNPKPYIHKAGKITQFFSTSDIDILYNNLAGFIKEAAYSYKFAQKDYSASFEVLKEETKRITVTVNIYIVEGQDKY